MNNIIYMGTPDFAVKPLQALIDSHYRVQAVFTQPDKPRGRSAKLVPTPVKETALAAGLAVYTPEKIREERYVSLIRDLAPDVIVVAAFGQLIPKAILEIPTYGCINIHASLLPKYRGAAPIQWAVIDGEKETGVTIMQMGEGLDTGDILLQEAVELAEDETGGSLFAKLEDLGAALLPKALEDLAAGRLTPTPQPEESTTHYAAMLTKGDGRLDWQKDAATLERLIRGLDPWPGTYTYLRGKQLKICRAQVREQQEPLYAPGTITAVEEHFFAVQTGAGELLVQQLQLEGKKRMDTGAFLRGCPLQQGEVLGDRMR